MSRRWNTLHDTSEEKSATYEQIMASWQQFREEELTVLNWVDEKDRQVAENKNQVNFADEDEVAQQIQLLKVRDFTTRGETQVPEILVLVLFHQLSSLQSSAFGRVKLSGFSQRKTIGDKDMRSELTEASLQPAMHLKFIKHHFRNVSESLLDS